MKTAIFMGVVLAGMALCAVSGVAYAQGPFANISARAEYRDPAVDEELKAYPTVAEWAAAGYQAAVSAKSLSNHDDSPENVAKSEAFFSQSPVGVGVARGYGFSGANYGKYPVNVSTKSLISSQFTLRVQGEYDPLSPFVMKGYLPVHGVFSAFDFTHEVHSAIASALTGVRVQTNYHDENNQPTVYDVTRGGTVTVRSKDYDYNPDNPAFEVEATDDFVNAVTMRHDLNDPEGYNWTSHAAELSQLIVFDLPLDVIDFYGTVDQEFTITFLQEINTSLDRAAYKFAYADLRSTTGFQILAINPNTGAPIDGAISVQLRGGGGPGGSAAAPEPATVALLGVGLLGFWARRRK